MSAEVRVALGERGYDIVIKSGALRHAADWLGPYLTQKRPVVVTDTNVAAAHLSTLCTALGDVHPIILTPGEGSKSWHQLSALIDQLLALGLERSDHIIALGGGVIGDLVGFAAAILKRGCNFVQIPTTLLAQVDSSVGGKTAINVAAGKNLVGAFHQPALVLIDPDVLDTLPLRDVRAGYAEVVKYGLINDAGFFGWCEANCGALLSGDAGARSHAIRHSIAAKAAVVAADERETADVRALLNLGHTFGHALEAHSGCSDALLHGEAVAAGMALAFRMSARLGLCGDQVAERVVGHLAHAGLPHSLASAGVRASGNELVEHMRHDKKMTSGTLPFILARNIGETFVDKSVMLRSVADFLDHEP
jgi:3-dehydroquinate synthase